MTIDPLAARDSNPRSTDNAEGISSLPVSGKREAADVGASVNHRIQPLDPPESAPIDFYEALGLSSQFDDNFVDTFVHDLGFNGAVPSTEAVEVAKKVSPHLLASAKSLPAPENVLWSIPNWDQTPAFDAATTVSADSLPSLFDDSALKRLFADASPPAAEPLRFSPTGFLGVVPEGMQSLANALPIEPLFAKVGGDSQYPDPQDPLVNEPYAMVDVPPAPASSTKEPTTSNSAGRRTTHPHLQLQQQAQKRVAFDELTPPSSRFGSPQPRAESSPKASKTFGFSPSKPKRSPEHPWVRSSGHRAAPQGTARTGKINKYNPERHYIASTRIVENLWRASNGTRFEYNRSGELDLSSVKLSIDDMRAFLYENPATPVLWIQTCPADSARRYNTVGSSKCRFKDCPASVYKNTIAVGILRVAIDEAWPTLGTQRDPFHCAGFMHLYCAERFLDWPAACADLDVRVDDRIFASEPNGRFAASLFNTRVADVAASFIKCARYDALHGTAKLLEKFPCYPPHTQPAGPPKDHPHTLTYAMMSVKINTMTTRRVEVLSARGERGSHMQQHLGDLQQAVHERRTTAMQKKRKREMDQLREAGVAPEDEADVDADVVSATPEAAPPQSQSKRPRLLATPSKTSSSEAAAAMRKVRLARRAALAAELSRLDAAISSDADDKDDEGGEDAVVAAAATLLAGFTSAQGPGP